MRSDCFAIEVADLNIFFSSDSKDVLSKTRDSLKSFLISSDELPEAAFTLKTRSSVGKLKNGELPEIIHKNNKFLLVGKGPSHKAKLGVIDPVKKSCYVSVDKSAMNRIFPSFFTHALALFLAEFEGFILHGCAAISKSKGFVFIGPSGSGKTTVAGFLRDKGLTVVSDERIIIRRLGDDFFVYPFPWYGNVLAGCPIKGIFFLKKSDRVLLDPLSPAHAVREIFPEISILLPSTLVGDRLLSVLQSLLKKIPAYQMEFSRDSSFWDKIRKL